MGAREDSQANIFKYNNAIRDRLIEYARRLGSVREQVKFIVNYFTNNLPKDITAKIDDVKELQVVDFGFDYSFLSGLDTSYPRVRKYFDCPAGRGRTETAVFCDLDIDGRPFVFPTLFAFKQGTCVMFANELKRLMGVLGIDCQMIKTPEKVECYDYFDGQDELENKINVNEIRKMYHWYNIINIDGKDYKVDIAGYLMAMDYNKNHPKGREDPINPGDFCLTEKIDHNPFVEETVMG